MKQVTIEEARKLIGPKASAELTDEQLAQLIRDFEIIARETLRAIALGEMKLSSRSSETGNA